MAPSDQTKSGLSSRAGRFVDGLSTPVKIAYFAGGLAFMVASKFFVTFWVRLPVLFLWAMGLAVLLARTLGAPSGQSSGSDSGADSGDESGG